MPDPLCNAKELKQLALDCYDRGGLMISIPRTMATEIANQIVGLHAEHRKNFDLLCNTEKELAVALMKNRANRPAASPAPPPKR